MRSVFRPTPPSFTRIVEFCVGLAAILGAYMLFLLVSDNAKFLELVILLFELQD